MQSQQRYPEYELRRVWWKWAIVTGSPVQKHVLLMSSQGQEKGAGYWQTQKRLTGFQREGDTGDVRLSPQPVPGQAVVPLANSLDLARLASGLRFPLGAGVSISLSSTSHWATIPSRFFPLGHLASEALLFLVPQFVSVPRPLAALCESLSQSFPACMASLHALLELRVTPEQRGSSENCVF